MKKKTKAVIEKEAKKAISSLVNSYKMIYRKEYREFLKQMKSKYSKVDNASLKMTEVKRALYEVPETLHVILQVKLTVEELKYLRNPKKKDGAIWFAKTFPEFTIPTKV